MLSPDRRGGRLTGPALPAGAQPQWTSTSTASRSGPLPSISCEPAGQGQRGGRQSLPPFTPQSMLAQQACVALGQSTGEMPATARPQWRDSNGYQHSPLPVRNGSASSANSLHIPVGGSSSGTCSLGSRGCSAVVPVPVKTTISDDNSATTRFTTPVSTTSPVSVSQSQAHRVTVECRRQQSTGACSQSGSLPSHSPVTAPREPKLSTIEVPLTANPPKRREDEAVPVSTTSPVSVSQSQAHRVTVACRRQLSTGACSQSGSLPSHSPVTAPREPKLSTIEVPLSANPPKRREDEAVPSAEVLEKPPSELGAVEDLKRIHDVQGEMSQDVKGVKNRVEAIETWLKEGKAEALEVALRERQDQLEQAQRVAMCSQQQLEEREEELLQLRRASEALEVALRERQDQLEQAQRAAMFSQQQLEEREEELLDLRRASEARGADTADLERKLKESGEECNTYRVRFSHLQFQIDQQTDELQRRIAEATRLQERLDLEAQERRALETRLSTANGHYQTLSMEHRSLQEQVEQKNKMHDQKLDSLDHSIRLREQQVAELESDVATRQRALIAKEEEFAKTELAMKDQHREKEQLTLDQENLEKECQEMREKQRKLLESDKENRSLKATVQEQKGLLFDLESQLHREQTISNFITPGEFIRLAKKQEGELYAHDNADLRLKNFGLETDVQQVRWHNEVMKKHLPRSAWAEVSKDMNSQPLPTNLSTKEASPQFQLQTPGESARQ
eukprot:CAMPEP_0172777720 /NCGR_PEP_ID=MMETSP1074-20121228/201542_1 /TAXON_ID=2916 /ORGANISM="Ceratium fusus, Strain PA161109" /LENGTH=735 /DNA_ID=CAMNT_0013614649 /DNA_START=97 /DNA_END=2304 /DNA_ORIENTATION=+